MRIGLVKLLLPLTLLLGGCTTAPQCDELGKCGGNFLADLKDLGGGVMGTEWAARSTDACVDQVPAAVSPPSLSLIPARPAGVRAVEPSTTEWCGGLVLRNDGTVGAFDDGWYETLQQYRGWFPSVPLWTARLEIHQGNRHVLEAKQLVAQRYELSATCLYAQGVNLSCEELNTALVTYLEEDKLANLSGVDALVYGASCTGDSSVSCTCNYNLELTTTTGGAWSTGPGEITFYDDDAAPPSETEYCVSGGGLELTGSKATDLFNRGSLKTLKFKPASCTDGVQSKSTGETGIDCGGTCGPCPQ